MTVAPIVVIGSLNMDVVVPMEQFPRPGETVLGDAYRTFTGGKGANQAVAAALAGGTVSMQGAVGTDGFGRELLQTLGMSGVETQDVRRLAGPSGIASIWVDAAGDNAIAVSPGANGHYLPQHLNVEAIRFASLVMVQLEMPMETVEHAITVANEAKVPVLLNPAPMQILADRLLEQVTYLVVNEVEAAELAGLDLQTDDGIIDIGRAQEAARRLCDRGVSHAIVTLGGSGVVWAARSDGATGVEEGWCPAMPVDVVDTTAAGDGFCGALAVALAEGQPLEVAIAFGNGAGAIAVTRLGAQASLGTREDILALLAQAEPETTTG